MRGQRMQPDAGPNLKLLAEKKDLFKLKKYLSEVDWVFPFDAFPSPK